MRMRWILPLIAVCALTVAGGCSLPEPYVYKFKEFDRSRPDFSKDEVNRTQVGICYNKRNTTPQHIVELAQAECAKYQKVARFKTQNVLICPILTPVQAIFSCEPSGDQHGGTSSSRY